jgi:hypothetical protein
MHVLLLLILLIWSILTLHLLLYLKVHIDSVIARFNYFNLSLRVLHICRKFIWHLFLTTTLIPCCFQLISSLGLREFLDRNNRLFSFNLKIFENYRGSWSRLEMKIYSWNRLSLKFQFFQFLLFCLIFTYWCLEILSWVRLVLSSKITFKSSQIRSALCMWRLIKRLLDNGRKKEYIVIVHYWYL